MTYQEKKILRLERQVKALQQVVESLMERISDISNWNDPGTTNMWRRAMYDRIEESNREEAR